MGGGEFEDYFPLEDAAFFFVVVFDEGDVGYWVAFEADAFFC